MCEDDTLRINASGLSIGSPPRVWGRPAKGASLAVSARFTPTCVGTTRIPNSLFSSHSVHPHMRGYRNHGLSTLGSSALLTQLWEQCGHNDIHMIIIILPVQTVKRALMVFTSSTLAITPLSSSHLFDSGLCENTESLGRLNAFVTTATR